MDTFHIEISEKDLKMVEDLLNASGIEHAVNRPFRAYCRAEAIAILDNVADVYQEWNRSFYPYIDTIIEREKDIHGADRDALIEAIADWLWDNSDTWIDSPNRDEEIYCAIVDKLDI